MKKLLLVLLFASSAVSVFSQTDSLLTKKIDSLSQKVLKLQSAVDSLTKRSTTAQTSCYSCKGPISWKQKAIILSPVILFFIVAGYAAFRAKKEGFAIADALDETTPKIKTIPNPVYDATTAAHGVSPTIDITDTPNRSSSRMIAFLSGLTAIVIGISSVSYFFYMYFRTGQEPNLNHIYDILLALGIGVTPYAFNKISDAVKK